MSEQPRTAPKPDASMPRWMVWTRRILVAAGSAAVVNAAIGLPSNLTNTQDQHHYLQFLVKAFLLTLVALLPAVLAVGRLLRRHVSARWRPVLQGTLFITLMLVIVALPALTGKGRVPDLPSALPRDYVRGLAIALGAVWSAALVLIAAQTVRRRKEKDPSP
jgi:hypothetical protein